MLMNLSRSRRRHCRILRDSKVGSPFRKFQPKASTQVKKAFVSCSWSIFCLFNRHQTESTNDLFDCDRLILRYWTANAKLPLRCTCRSCQYRTCYWINICSPTPPPCIYLLYALVPPQPPRRFPPGRVSVHSRTVRLLHITWPSQKKLEGST